MTTIAYKDGVICADCRAYTGDTNFVGYKKKLHIIKGTGVCGFSTSSPGIIPEVVSAIAERKSITLPNDSDLIGLFVDLEKKVKLILKHNILDPEEVYNDFFAVGSGAKFALGAMELGASAEQAVRVACKYDVWSSADKNGNLNIINIDDIIPYKKLKTKIIKTGV